MPKHNILIQVSSVPEKSFWFRLEQVGFEDDSANFEDVAELLDEAFQVSACKEENTPELISEEAYEEVSTTIMKYLACGQEYNGDLEVQIKVIKSHPDEIYNMVGVGCEILNTIAVDEQVTRKFKIESNQVEIDYPVLGNFTASVPFSRRYDNIVVFSNEHIGKVFTATFDTSYDLVSVNLFGINGDRGEGHILCFYHAMVEKLDIEVPEAEEINRAQCPKFRLVDGGLVTCYRTVHMEEICSCSNSVLRDYTYDEDCPCGKNYECEAGVTSCRIYLGTVAQSKRVECVDDVGLAGTGGFAHDVSKRSYYKEKCCEYPSFELPNCPEEKRDYPGDMPIEHGEAYYIEKYGPNVKFVPMLPDSGSCGDWIIRQDIESIPCCETIPPLRYDEDNSVDIMVAEDTGMIYVLDGVGPFMWRITSQDDGGGLWFKDSGHAFAIETDENTRWATLESSESPCGLFTITVTDDCGTVVTGQIFSAEGQWVARVNPDPPDPYDDEIWLPASIPGIPFSSGTRGFETPNWSGTEGMEGITVTFGVGTEAIKYIQPFNVCEINLLRAPILANYICASSENVCSITPEHHGFSSTLPLPYYADGTYPNYEPSYYECSNNVLNYPVGHGDYPFDPDGWDRIYDPQFGSIPFYTGDLVWQAGYLGLRVEQAPPFSGDGCTYDVCYSNIVLKVTLPEIKIYDWECL